MMGFLMEIGMNTERFIEINKKILDIEKEQEILAKNKGLLIRERFDMTCPFAIGQVGIIQRQKSHVGKQGVIIEIENNRCISRVFVVQLFKNNGELSKIKTKIYNEISFKPLI